MPTKTRKWNLPLRGLQQGLLRSAFRDSQDPRPGNGGSTLRHTLRVFTVVLVSGAALAQQPDSPRFYYRAGTSGNFSIFNSTAVFHGDPGSPSFTYTRTPLRLSPQGSGTASQNGRGQTARATLRGYADYGSISYSADLLAEVSGQFFTGQNSTAYFTGYCHAAGTLEMGYQDELRVVSASLPTGRAVTLRMRVRYFGQRSQTTRWPEWVVIPPTSPGGQSTTIQEMRSSVDNTFRRPGEHGVRFHVLRPNGAQANAFNFEGLLSGEKEFDFTAEVGGKVLLTHFLATPALATETRAATATHLGDRESAHTLSGFGTVRVWSLTSGVELESLSGARYAPATGHAVLDARFVGDELQVIAPIGSVFQKVLLTPQGLTWSDLPETELLVVPMTESQAAYRALLP